jgi:hypothetical protein
MPTIRLDKNSKTIRIVNRKDTLKLTRPRDILHLQHIGKTGQTGADGTPGTIVAVQNTAPPNPNTGDLWVDTSV